MASFSEVVPFVRSAEISWGLSHSVLRYNGYEIPYSDEMEICGTRGVNQVKLWLQISSTSIEVSCKGLMESWCRKKVEEFTSMLKKEISSYSAQREQQYLKVTREHMPTLGYVLPANLAAPLPVERPKPFYAFGVAIILLALLTALYSEMWSAKENWSAVVLLGGGPALGFAIRYSAVFGRYYDWKTLRILLVISSVIFSSIAFYIGMNRGIFDQKTTGAIVFMVIGFFCLPTLVGIAVLREGKQKVQKERVPVQVLVFARYLAFQNHSEASISSELSKRGWASNEDQRKVFDALQSYYEVQGILKTNLKKQ